MALYLVVRHQRAEQRWPNFWLADDRLETIQTTSEIGRLCEAAQRVGERVFVHRCAWQGGPGLICCSVLVSRVDRLSSQMRLVTFADPLVLGVAPVHHPNQGDNWYEETPVAT
jgi:hypothetical protein